MLVILCIILLDLPVLYSWTRPLPGARYLFYFVPTIYDIRYLTSSIWCCSLLGRNDFPAVQSWSGSAGLQWKERAMHKAGKSGRWHKRRRWQWAPQHIEKPRGWRNSRLKMLWSCAMLLSSYLESIKMKASTCYFPWRPRPISFPCLPTPYIHVLAFK